jgi:predicted dehydrogenase
MPTRDGKLGVGVSGVGWCASQHIAAFQKNPHTVVTWLHGRDEDRTRANLAKYDVTLPEARVTTSYDDLLAAADVDVISITTPNHLHAEQAVQAAQAGKHLVLEKPTGLDTGELVSIRDAVRRAGIRTIVSFELRYNPYLKFARWLRESGWLGEIRFARTQYLSRVTDWYSGWEWVRTRESGRSHLLAAGCHAVDALRWCSGYEPVEVSALHTHFTKGYEWPTSIVVNMTLGDPSAPHTAARALGHVTSSTDFMMPYAFLVELMGDRATLRQDLLQWLDVPLDLEQLAAANPFEDVRLEPATDGSGRPAIRIRTTLPGSADVSHHPFQDEIDELVACILEGRETSISVFDAQKTMEACLAADRSADLRGQPVRLPLIAE